MLNSPIWLAVRIAAAVTLVVVTFGYAITGNHSDVLMGAGCGIAVGASPGSSLYPQIGVVAAQVAQHEHEDAGLFRMGS